MPGHFFGKILLVFKVTPLEGLLWTGISAVCSKIHCNWGYIEHPWGFKKSWQQSINAL